MTITQAWASLADMEADQKAVKNEVLMLFVTGGDWQHKLLTVTQAVAKESRWKEEYVPLSRGELIQKLGYDEAVANIEKGKYEEVEDSDGDVKYVKKEKRSSKAVRKTDSISTTRIYGFVSNHFGEMCSHLCQWY